jgi:hypothetical protein
MQAFISRYYQSLVAIILIVVVGVAFYTGFLEGKRNIGQPVTLACNQNILSKLSIPLESLATPANAASLTDSSNNAMENKAGTYVGSKNGTKYYSSLTCAGAKRIKPANYIWFNSAQDAQIEGYNPGKC